MKLNKTFIIRHKDTHEQWVSSSGKSSWKQIGHAKTAFKSGVRLDLDKDVIFTTKSGTGYNRKEVSCFDDQTYYEVIELKHESEEQLELAKELLQTIVIENAYDNISVGLRVRINEFLRSVNKC